MKLPSARTRSTEPREVRCVLCLKSDRSHRATQIEGDKDSVCLFVSPLVLQKVM